MSVRSKILASIERKTEIKVFSKDKVFDCVGDDRKFFLGDMVRVKDVPFDFDKAPRLSTVVATQTIPAEGEFFSLVRQELSMSNHEVTLERFVYLEGKYASNVGTVLQEVFRKVFINLYQEAVFEVLNRDRHAGATFCSPKLHNAMQPFGANVAIVDFVTSKANGHTYMIVVALPTSKEIMAHRGL